MTDLREVKIGGTFELRFVSSQGKGKVAAWLARDLLDTLKGEWRMEAYDHPEFRGGHDDEYSAQHMLYSEHAQVGVGERMVSYEEFHPLRSEADLVDDVCQFIRSLRKTGLVDRIEQFFFAYRVHMPVELARRSIDLSGSVAGYNFWDVVQSYTTTLEHDGHLYRIDVVLDQPSWHRDGDSAPVLKRADALQILVHGAESFGERAGWKQIIDAILPVVGRTRAVLLRLMNQDLRDYLRQLLAVSD